MLRHGSVDLAGQLDKPGALPKFSGLPRQVKRIYRYAMAAQAGAGVKRHVSKRLGPRCVDYFPDIDAHGRVNHFEFVDQRNVDPAKDVFQQLGRFGGTARGDGDHCFDGPAVNRDCLVTAGCGVASDHLGDLRHLAVGIARIFALWRKRQVKILSCFQTRSGLQHRAEVFVGRARISGGLQNHHRALPQMRRNRNGRLDDVGNVRLAVFVQWRRHADDDRLHGLDFIEICRSRKAFGRELGLDGLAFDVLDVTLSLVQGIYFDRIDIQSEHFDSRPCELQRKRKPDITQPDDRNFHKWFPLARSA